MDWSTLLMVALMGAALYFLLLRPQQKRAKEQKEKLASLEPGSRVMTISGIIGTISHLGEKQAIMEIAPGVEITVDKRAISTQAIEDEFEYVDADSDAEPAVDETLVADEPVTFDPTPPAAGAEVSVVDEAVSFDPTPPAADPEDPRQN